MMIANIPTWFVLALAGAVGQMLRAVQGVKKAVERGEKISASKLFWTIVFAAFSGSVIGYFYPDWRAAFLGGYAATDFVEGVVKAISIKHEKEVKAESRRKKKE